MMTYSYQSERPKLFTPEGLSCVLEIHSKAQKLTKAAGCFCVGSVLFGDAWLALAAVDYLVETKKLLLVSSSGLSQNHVYRSVDTE